MILDLEPLSQNDQKVVSSSCKRATNSNLMNLAKMKKYAVKKTVPLNLLRSHQML